MLRNGLTWCAAALLLAATLGCGDGRPRRVPVAGKVLLDGQPLSTGSVQFVPEHGRPAGGMILPDGSFRLTCYEHNDGATLGTHMVSVTSAQALNPVQTKWFAPKKYSKPGTSGIQITVEESIDDLVIELEGEGGKPFQPYIEQLR